MITESFEIKKINKLFTEDNLKQKNVGVILPYLDLSKISFAIKATSEGVRSLQDYILQLIPEINGVIHQASPVVDEEGILLIKNRVGGSVTPNDEINVVLDDKDNLNLKEVDSKEVSEFIDGYADERVYNQFDQNASGENAINEKTLKTIAKSSENDPLINLDVFREKHCEGSNVINESSVISFADKLDMIKLMVGENRDGTQKDNIKASKNLNAVVKFAEMINFGHLTIDQSKSNTSNFIKNSKTHISEGGAKFVVGEEIKLTDYFQKEKLENGGEAKDSFIANIQGKRKYISEPDIQLDEPIREYPQVTNKDADSLALKLKQIETLRSDVNNYLEKITAVQYKLDAINNDVLINFMQVVDKLNQDLPYELQEDFCDRILSILSFINKIVDVQYSQDKKTIPIDIQGIVSQARLQLFEFCSEMYVNIELYERKNVNSIGLDKLSSLSIDADSEIEVDFNHLFLLEQKIFSKNNFSTNSLEKINQQLKDLLSGESDLAIMLISSIAYLAMTQLNIIDLNNSLGKLSNMLDQQGRLIEANTSMGKLFSNNSDLATSGYNQDKISSIANNNDEVRKKSQISILRVIDRNINILNEELLLTEKGQPSSILDIDHEQNNLQFIDQNQLIQLIEERVAEFGSKLLEVNMFMQKQVELESKGLLANLDEYQTDLDLASAYLEKLSNYSE